MHHDLLSAGLDGHPFKASGYQDEPLDAFLRALASRTWSQAEL